MSYRFVPISFVCFILLFASYGCGGPKAPEGFPKTVPFQITVVNAGKPIEKVNVIFIPAESKGQTAWTISGFTNSSGVAIMQTVSGSYSRQGVPEGAFKVVLSKPIELDPALLGPEPSNRVEQAAYEAKAAELRKKMTPDIPSVYSDNSSTPATVTVSKGTSSETIDVSQAKQGALEKLGSFIVRLLIFGNPPDQSSQTKQSEAANDQAPFLNIVSNNKVPFSNDAVNN